MSSQNLSKEKTEWYAPIKKFGNNFVEPLLEVLVYLWLPALTALLSLIFFFLDPTNQILEIYRVFALNPSPELIRIICSFISIFILSLLIWYSGRNLLEEKKKREIARANKKGEDKPNDSQSSLTETEENAKL